MIKIGAYEYLLLPWFISIVPSKSSGQDGHPLSRHNRTIVDTLGHECVLRPSRDRESGRLNQLSFSQT